MSDAPRSGYGHAYTMRRAVPPPKIAAMAHAAAASYGAYPPQRAAVGANAQIYEYFQKILPSFSVLLLRKTMAYLDFSNRFF